jgi:Tfp pilus assembly protein PilF
MSCRHGCTLLALVSGLLTTAGCIDCRYCGPQMALVASQPVLVKPAATELPAAQAAQLCLAAGEALEQKGYQAEARQQFESARQHDPQLRGVARHLAVLYDLQGEQARAEAEYTRALQEQPNDATLLNDMGYFRYRHDRLQPAENWLRKAVAVDPGCRCAWINLGQVLARQGRPEDSYAAFAHALRPAEAYSNLGVLLAKQGRTDEARTALQQALKLDPSLEQPRVFLSALPSAPALLPPGLTHAAPAPSPSVPASPPTPYAPTSAAVPAARTPPPIRMVPPVPRALPTTLPHPSTVTQAPPPPAAPVYPPAVVTSAPAQPCLVPVAAPQPVTSAAPSNPPAASSPNSAPDDQPIIISSPIRQTSVTGPVSHPAPPAPPTPPASPTPPVLQWTGVPPPPPKVEERPPQVVITDCEGVPESTPP